MLNPTKIKVMKILKEEFKKINKNLTIQSLGYTIDLLDDDNIFV